MSINYTMDIKELRGFTSKNKEISYEDMLTILNEHMQDKHVQEHYSKNVEPTIDGMLGGLAYVHSGDVEWSVNFLRQLQRQKVIKTGSVLDIGAGIGRVSHYTLHPVFKHVDMLEQCQKYIEESTKNFAKDSIRQRYCLPIQSIGEISQKYDVCWVQWVVGHINDIQFVQFLEQCNKMCEVIIIKDNISVENSFFFDEEDFNVLRPISIFKDIFDTAGLQLIGCYNQVTWPANLMPIRCFVLRKADKQV